MNICLRITTCLAVGALSLGVAQSPTEGSTPTGSASISQVARKAVITISMNGFSSPTRVQAGAVVKVVNKDNDYHSMTSNDNGKSFDILVPPLAKINFQAPTNLGKYAFHCSFHNSMHGTLIVKA